MHPLENRVRILERVRRHEAISRTELATQVGLGQATVSVIVRELVDHGILHETRLPGEGRGRPRLALMQNREALRIGGAFVHIGGRVDFQIGDLAGDVLARASAQADDPVDARALVGAIARAYAQATDALATEGLDGARPAAIGLSLPAMIDGKRGDLRWLPPHGPQCEPLGAWLEEAIGVPVYLDNVGNIFALAERWFGSEAFNDDLCVVAVGPGIAAGQFVEGMIHRGARGLNPEIGHTKTGIGAERPCICGAKGCLVQTAGLVGVAVHASELGLWEGEPLLEYRACLARLVALSGEGDHTAARLLGRCR